MPHGYNDRPTITADTRAPTRLYAVWVFHNGSESADLAFGRDTVLMGESDDRGRRWSAHVICQAPQGNSLWGTQIFPLGRRRFVITYRSIGSNGWGIFALRSSDGGRRWIGPRRIGALTPGLVNASGINMTIVVNDLSAPEPQGALDTVWSDNTSDGHGHVWLSRATDGGRSWGLPRSIANTSCETMLPAVAVNGSTIGVSYYAFRKCALGSAPLVDVWFAASNDRGVHWRTTHLAGPFDLRSALSMTFKPSVKGELTGPFLGDYTGLAPTATGFGAIMILPKPYARYGQQDVFFRNVAIQGGQS